jgi:cathepsin B
MKFLYLVALVQALDTDAEPRNLAQLVTDLSPTDERVVSCLDLIRASLQDCYSGEILVDAVKANEDASCDCDDIHVHVAIYDEPDEDTYNKYTCEYKFSSPFASALGTIGARGVGASSVEVIHPYDNKCDALSKSNSDERPPTFPLGYGDGLGSLGGSNPDSELPEAPAGLGNSLGNFLGNVGEDLPEAFSLIERYPTCHNKVIMNQGSCGSCWAFAPAASLRATACQLAYEANAMHIVKNAQDGHNQASTQLVMSCNAQQRGCNGGWMRYAYQVWDNLGSVKEMHFPYNCRGGGKGDQHFDDESPSNCRSFPWGRQCPTVSKDQTASKGLLWGGVNVEGYYSVPKVNNSIITGMMQELYSQGSFTVGFLVKNNFFSFPFSNGSVYTSCTGSTAGGHAVAMVGYGTKDGTAFWMLQNSWGESWGDDGYFRMKKGVNICNMESMSLTTSRISINTSAPDNDDPTPNPDPQPEPTTQAPPTTQDPMPEPTTQAPPTTRAPSPTPAPVTTTRTTRAPVSTTRATSTAAPVSTTRAPVSTTAGPVSTTAGPVSTTAAPVSTRDGTDPDDCTTPAPPTANWIMFPESYARANNWLRARDLEEGSTTRPNKCFGIEMRGWSMCKKWLREDGLWSYCGGRNQDCSQCPKKMLEIKRVNRQWQADEKPPGKCLGSNCWCDTPGWTNGMSLEEDAKSECAKDSRCKGFFIKKSSGGDRYQLMKEPKTYPKPMRRSNITTMCDASKTEHCDRWKLESRQLSAEDLDETSIPELSMESNSDELEQLLR